MTTTEALCFAVATRRVVEFLYDGLTRAAEPFCCGVSATGKEVVRAYQVGGESGSGDAPGWKLFDIGKIADLAVTDREFDLRADFNPLDPALETVYCCR